ncbi:MAG: hypothetical protein HYR62_05990 [Actinobacteria bacterium]|nr:hypothetical protein [Actinomycetota bacterium]
MTNDTTAETSGTPALADSKYERFVRVATTVRILRVLVREDGAQSGVAAL